MKTKHDVMLDQLNKYCNLGKNERIIVIDEKIIRKESMYRKPMWGAKNKDRVAKATLMHWEREIENYRHKIRGELTTEDVVSLKQSMEIYQRILDSITCGFNGYTRIEKTDILETLISNTKSELFEDIEFKKKGFIRERIHGWLYNQHVVTVIECEEFLTIKEIYIPYGGIVIQLPTDSLLK
jgi:hypothetical protein